MSQMAMDRAYANLLSHLQRPSSRLPLQTVFSAVSHYLSHLPLPHPTQLTAFVMTSSLWKPLSVEDVWSLTNAFRSAVHLKHSNIQGEASGWFLETTSSLDGWIRAVMKGVSRGDAYLRIAILGGLLLGLEDITRGESRYEIRNRVEAQVIIAFAEILESLSTTHDEWKTEFTTRGNGKHEDILAKGTMFLYMICQISPMVSSPKLRALDLSVVAFTSAIHLCPEKRPQALIHLSQAATTDIFLGGDFISSLSHAITKEHNGRIVISPILWNPLRSVTQGVLYQIAGPLAKLLARALSQLAEATPEVAWQAFYYVCQEMESLACRVEGCWKPSGLAAVTSEQDIEPQSRELSTEIWSILKTLLFSHVLVSQSILSSISFMRLPPGTSSSLGPSAIARLVLRSLHHLSFVLSRFGGVASSAEGFKELKRVFYMAIDIVAADPDPRGSNSFVEELLSTLDSQLGLKHPLCQAKVAYVLTVIEQLVPMLSESILESQVIPFCNPYLGDPQDRETYESAHSVVLSIFARQAKGKLADDQSTLAERLVPFYVNSLIENSGAGRLSGAQLRLAYSSLVQSAASNGDDSLAWLCVEALLSRIHISASDSPERVDLYSTLVSLISCVPFSLLLRQLEEVEKVFETVNDESKKVLAKEVLEEITARVGDHERETALFWWSSVAPRLSVQE